MGNNWSRSDWDRHFREVSKGRSDTSIFGAEDMSTIEFAQARLNVLGYGPLTVDGIDGPLTQAAVKRFQVDKGLTVDGIIGPQTSGALGITHSLPTQTVLPAVATPLTPDQAVKALSYAYQKVASAVPSPAILANMVGQTALETGNWQKIDNYNFGGIKASASDPYVQSFNTTEVINGVSIPMVQKFAAYKSANDGAIGYVKMLKMRSNWWDGLLTGTPEGFNAGLTSSPAYYTASPAEYLAGMVSRANSYMALANKYAVKIGVGIMGVLLTMVGLGGAVLFGYKQGWIK